MSILDSSGLRGCIDDLTGEGAPSYPQSKALAVTIVHWLYENREPSDLYELLGRLRFDPRRGDLLAGVRAMYGELLPYQNHKNPQVVQRAVELQRLLGHAEDTLSDAGKLRAHHEAILESLRRAYARAGGAPGLCGNHLLEWLRLQSVHPERLQVVAGLLTAKPGEPFVLVTREPRGPPSAADEFEGIFELEEPSIPAEVVDEAPVEVEKSPAQRPLEPASGLSPGRPAAPAARSQRLAWYVVNGLGAVFLLFLLVAVIPSSESRTWRGELVDLCGHDGEIHLLIRREDDSFVEAFTREYRFGEELADYWSAEELTAMRGSQSRARAPGGPGASRVILRGDACDRTATRFRLSPSASLVEIKAIQKAGDRRSLAVVGDGVVRVRSRLRGSRSELASLLRIHPPLGDSVRFPARYRNWRRGAVFVSPGVNDLRLVRVEFEGTPADFVGYRENDEVIVEAEVSSRSTPSQLVVVGRSIRRAGEPAEDRVP